MANKNNWFPENADQTKVEQVEGNGLDFLEGSNVSDAVNVAFSNLYWARWNAKDPAARNFYVDPDTLEVRSQYWEHMTIVPILATIMLAATVFLLVLFKQSPTLVATIVAGCLTIIGIYLVLCTLSESRIRYG